ncbi:MAG: hypothetical protein OHK0046_15270 [Anaerolineae bacterium]
MKNNRHNYDEYETLFDPMKTDRQARRKRKPKAKHQPKKAAPEILDEIADPIALEGGFKITYVPSLYEAEWLLSSLNTFYDQHFITDVMAQVKGGKEASVYRCLAHPSVGTEYIAAKVYRPRRFRSLSNDAMYREGRETLRADGKAVQGNEDRVIRALGKKTAFGLQVAHTSWLMHEYTTLELLHNLGAPVPKPYAVGENGILMSYIGDENLAAPTLNRVRLETDEAHRLFKRVIQTILLMLENDIIHGDLSAYNILYWEGDITIIDFPQVVHSQSNSAARMILKRDVTRICEYFATQGVETNPEALTENLWKRVSPFSAETHTAERLYLMEGYTDAEDR